MKSLIAFQRRPFFGAAIAALLLAAAVPAAARTTITLTKDFIEEFENRVTIDADFLIDEAHTRPNSPSKDGDLHIAGRPPDDVGLTTVAEIMNAKEMPTVVPAVHDAEGSGQTVDVEGVWRLWPENRSESAKVRVILVDDKAVSDRTLRDVTALTENLESNLRKVSDEHQRWLTSNRRRLKRWKPPA